MKLDGGYTVPTCQSVLDGMFEIFPGGRMGAGEWALQRPAQPLGPRQEHKERAAVGGGRPSSQAAEGVSGVVSPSLPKPAGPSPQPATRRPEQDVTGL